MNDQDNEEPSKVMFDFCDKVDLHALPPSICLDTVVAIAGEHGFRGIIVTLGRLQELVKEINRPIFGDKKITPICAIDYPYGMSSQDVRGYSIRSAAEKGAKEVEVIAPYHLLVAKDFKAIYEDAQNLLNISSQAGIDIKYVLDQSSEFVDESISAKICRILSSTRMPVVSTSLGFYDEKVDHADSILKMRNIKNKVGCRMKVFVGSDNPNDLASYIKAGADMIGLPWNKAPYLVHAYEEMVQKKAEAD